MMKKILSILLAAALLASLSVPALAVTDGDADNARTAETTDADAVAKTAEAAETMTEEAPRKYVVKGVTYPYVQQFSDDEDPTESEMTLYFVDDGDIPYVALDEYMALLGELLTEMGKGDVKYTVEELTDTMYIVTRPDNYSTMYVDTEDDTLYFMNLNGFTQGVGRKAAVTIKSLPEPDIWTEP